MDENEILVRPEDFFDLSSFEHSAVFDGCDYVWEPLARIGRFVLEYIMSTDGGDTIRGQVMAGAYIEDRNAVVIGKGTVVEPGAFIQGPAIIGQNCEIRHGAYVRGDVIIGDGCVVGHASEIKNAILLNGAGAPHFAYVGDSILGNNVNLGAGTKLANVPVVSRKDAASGRRPTIKIDLAGRTIDTGLSKFGCIAGDDVQIGCNAVTHPGCLIGPRTLVYPNVSLRKGYYPPDAVLKLRQDIERAERW